MKLINYKLLKHFWVGSFRREPVPIQQKKHIKHLRLYSQIAPVIHLGWGDINLYGKVQICTQTLEI